MDNVAGEQNGPTGRAARRGRQKAAGRDVPGAGVSAPGARGKARLTDGVLGEVVLGENLEVLRALPGESTELIYVDPPFNTGRRQQRTRVRAVQDAASARRGFGGRAYRTERVLGPESPDEPMYDDTFEDFVGFLRPRMEEARRVLTRTGSLMLHVDPREVHYCKVMLDEVFGRACFQNEIIWAYDYGARPSRRWPPKHENILWYTRDPKRWTFHRAASDRIPYLAPTLAGAEKAGRGKTPTDVWWHTIVSPTGKEKTGYPTQKPLGVLERMVRVHSNPGDLVLDFFAGSGTAGEAAARHGRRFLMVDRSPRAVRVMRQRLAPWLAQPAQPSQEPAQPSQQPAQPSQEPAQPSQSIASDAHQTPLQAPTDHAADAPAGV